MSTNDDEYLEAPSGTRYHIPPGEEIARIDGFLRRMTLTRADDKYPADVDFLLDARCLLASSTETGDTP